MMYSNATLPALTGAVFLQLETTHAPSFPLLALVVAAAAVAEGVGVATG